MERLKLEQNKANKSAMSGAAPAIAKRKDISYSHCT